MTNNFVHLHVHSEYSIADSVAQIKKMVKKAKELNMEAIAITDHGVMIGVYEFYKECIANHIKPIIGCEIYVEDEENPKKYTHLVLLAKNKKGYVNLCHMCSLGYIDGFYSKPIVSKQLLQQYSDNLVCLSACIGGQVPKYILKDEYEKAKQTALFYQSLFGKDNYFLEIQYHGMKEQEKVNHGIVEIGKEIDAKIVATNDVHYVEREDYILQDVIKCIRVQKSIDDPTVKKFPSHEFYLKSYDEMLEIFDEEYLNNTKLVVDLCNFEFEKEEAHLPNYQIPDGFKDQFEYLRYLGFQGLSKKYGEKHDILYDNRLNYELDIINKMGFVNYFLIVWDYVNFAKNNGIFVGPGRGSGAGSILAYSLGITMLDPIKYNLLFERFLNPERISMPDFDIDFEPKRRVEIFEYVRNKYGKDCTAKVLAIQTLAPKQAILDVAKVFGVLYKISSQWASLIPEKNNNTIEELLELNQELKVLYQTNPTAKKVFDIAKRMVGLPRQTSAHAAALVISDKDIYNYAPLMTAKRQDGDGRENVVQFTKKYIEDQGLIKMDFLNLRTLTLIYNAKNAIKRKLGIDIDIENIPLDDKNVYEMLSKGETLGVFQLESKGMREYIMQLKPETFEDIIAMIALYRPGPMNNIPIYIQNKYNPNKIVYKDKRLASILDVTYGIVVYQEQVMQIFQEFAGFSLGRADIVRSAMSKKHMDILEKEIYYFKYGSEELGIDGCLKRGFSEEVVDSLIEDMKSFAEYAFNKAHSAAYANLTYQTAYMMCYYKEFMVAEILTSLKGNSKELTHYINLFKNNLGITLNIPSINESHIDFECSNKEILVGLLGINGIGEVLVNKIIDERNKNGKFKSLFDFFDRLYPIITKSPFEILVKSGAFDEFGINRKTLISNIDNIFNFYNEYRNAFVNKISSLYDFFPKINKYEMIYPVLDNKEEYTNYEKCEHELETLNLYLNYNPFSFYDKILGDIDYVTKEELIQKFIIEKNKIKENEVFLIPLVIYDVVEKTTKKKNKIGLLNVSSGDSIFDIIVSSTIYNKEKDLFVKGNVILAKVSIREVTHQDLEFNLKKVFAIPNNNNYNDRKINLLKQINRKSRTFKAKPLPIMTKNFEKNSVFNRDFNKEIFSVSKNSDYQSGLYFNCENKDIALKIMEEFEDVYGVYDIYFCLRSENTILNCNYLKYSIVNEETLNSIIKKYQFQKNEVLLVL